MISIQPITARYLDGFGPMRVLLSDLQDNIRPEVLPDIVLRHFAVNIGTIELRRTQLTLKNRKELVFASFIISPGVGFFS